MQAEVHEVADKQAWLDLRAKDITSTETPALFGLSPYLSAFELWHRKRGNEIVRIEETERMKWGTRLEAAIAAGAAEEHGWEIRPFKQYLSLPQLRMGSSFDFKVTKPSPAILEIKNVDTNVFHRHWIEDGERIEAPQHIELQVQHQLEVADMEQAYIVALVGGNTMRIIHRMRDREVGAAIRQKIASFWESVATNTPPSPDYRLDADFILKRLYGNAADGKVVEAGPQIDELLKRYHRMNQEIGELEDIQKAIKAQIVAAIGDASKVLVPSGTLTCGNTKSNPGTLITPDMIGTYYGARAGYRQFRFTPRKEK